MAYRQLAIRNQKSKTIHFMKHYSFKGELCLK